MSKKNEKFFGSNTDNIEQYYVGDFVIFYHNGVKCIGCLCRYQTWNFDIEEYEEQIVVNYLTENGIIGSVPATEIPLTTKVIGITMNKTFKCLDTNNETDTNALPELIRLFKNQNILN